MNDLRIYNFNSNEVRTLLIENEPWFVLKDVCDILELSNPTMVAGRLDGDEVTKFNLGGLSGESNIVNESGLYKVIFQSKKPEAKKFTKWVTSEVLPSIRKTGGYEVPTDPMAALKLMFEVQETDNKRIPQLIHFPIIVSFYVKLSYTLTAICSGTPLLISKAITFCS